MKEVRKRQVYTAEFKQGAVDLVLTQKMKKSQVSRNLGINPNLITKWVKEAELSGDNAFPGKGRLSPQEQKIKELEKKCRRLEMERDILKKATAFFANHGR